jgi:hypothetical protein
MLSSKLLLNSALRAAAHVKSSNLPEELAKSSAVFLSSAPSGGKFILPDRPYDYNALEREFLILVFLFVLLLLVANILTRSYSISCDFV